MATDDNSTDGRKHRKVAARPTLSGARRPASSEANRRRYQDPAQREVSRQRALRQAAKGLMGRPLGSYDGVRKEERERINEEARDYARKTILLMADKGILQDGDDPRAVEALQAALETMRVPSNQGTKLAAAKLILEYTKAKPAAKSEVTVNKAEEWLAAIAQEEKNDSDEEGPEGDAASSA